MTKTGSFDVRYSEAILLEMMLDCFKSLCYVFFCLECLHLITDLWEHPTNLKCYRREKMVCYSYIIHDENISFVSPGSLC